MSEDRGELGRALEQRVSEVRLGPRETRRAMSLCDGCGEYLKDCSCAAPVLQEETGRTLGQVVEDVVAEMRTWPAWAQPYRPGQSVPQQEETGTRPPKPGGAWGTCDWGGCDERSVDHRWSPEDGAWLEVCAVHREETGTRELDDAAIRRAWCAAGGPAFDVDYHPEVAIHAGLLRRFLAALPSGDGGRGRYFPDGSLVGHCQEDEAPETAVVRCECCDRVRPVGETRAVDPEGCDVCPVRVSELSKPAPPSGETGGRDKLLARIAALAGNQRVRAEGHATHRNPMGTLAEIERLATAAPPAGETGVEHPGKVGKCLCAYVGDVVTTRDSACPYHGSRGVELRRRADEHERAGCDAFAALARADAESADAEWEQRHGGGDPCTSTTPSPAAGETGDGRELPRVEGLRCPDCGAVEFLRGQDRICFHGEAPGAEAAYAVKDEVWLEVRVAGVRETPSEGGRA